MGGADSYTYYVNNLSMYDSNTEIANTVLQEVYRVTAMIQYGMTPEQAGNIMSAQIESHTTTLGKDQMQNFFYTYIMIFALYMVILLYGQMVATNVATEKSSRAMEVLITSAKPTSMMFGKVLASCLAGLIQLIAVFGSALVFYNINKSAWGDNMIIESIFNIPVTLFVYMLVFFILGFLMYAFMFGAIGSTASKLEDINTSVMPVTFLFIIAFIVVMVSMSSGNIDNTVMKVCSYVPFTSPTVNFRSTTKSFKNKTKIERPPEEWKVFENTHSAIIDRETFALVQELRQHRRRPTRTGIISMFSGILYCADCKEKLYYSVTNNYRREQAYFFCSAYRKNSDVCSAHYIREKVVYDMVYEALQHIFRMINIFEEEFAEKQMAHYGMVKKQELAAKKKQLTKSKKRIEEIDGLILKLFEDNAKGKLSDERYATMTEALEREQSELKSEVPQMEAFLSGETYKAVGLQKFIEKVKRLTEFSELTPEIVHEYVEKIEVHAPRYVDGKRVQLLDIYFSGVGIVREMTPEEMEEAFQKRLKAEQTKTA
ncbi:MAG: ABC transporter permease [Oscillospiraceae bacterium]|nr:ABC transporter permease [Oscillospiraceae bacterium]